MCEKLKKDVSLPKETICRQSKTEKSAAANFVMNNCKIYKFQHRHQVDSRYHCLLTILRRIGFLEKNYISYANVFRTIFIVIDWILQWLQKLALDLFWLNVTVAGYNP
jgi:hypothetical protein